MSGRCAMCGGTCDDGSVFVAAVIHLDCCGVSKAQAAEVARLTADLARCCGEPREGCGCELVREEARVAKPAECGPSIDIGDGEWCTLPLGHDGEHRIKAGQDGGGI